MLDYDDFKKVVEIEIYNFLTPEYSDDKFDVTTIMRTNEKLDGFMLIPKHKEGRSIPVMLFNYLYEEYLTTGDLMLVIRNAANRYLEACKKSIINTDDFLKKENIIMQLINTEQNIDFLKTVPHKKFLDLSIVCKFLVDVKSNEMLSAKIDYATLDKMNLKVDELYDLAVKNTKRLFPDVYESLDDIFKQIVMGFGNNDFKLSEIPLDETFYIASNKYKQSGAACIIYGDCLEKIAEIYKSNLYLIGSSIHEFLVTSVRNKKPRDIIKVVKEVNFIAVAPEDKLSDNVYFYNRQTKEISILKL